MSSFNQNFIAKFFAVILSILIAVPYSLAQEIGTVTYVEGRVDIFKAGSEKGTPLRADEPISIGDSIRTKSNSKAQIVFKDTSVLQLAESSKVKVEDFKIDDKGRRETATILLERGKVRTIIEKMPHSADFIIATPNSQGTITGSDVFAFYKAGNSGMLVAEGRLSIMNPMYPEEKIIVPAGNSVMVPKDDTPKGPREYLDLEKEIHERDTNVPLSVSRKDLDAIIRGTIAKMSGVVKIVKKGETAERDASINQILLEGDIIKTGEDGVVEIALDNGNILNLKPNTELKIVKLVMDPKTGEYENTFESSMGSIMAKVEGLKGQSTFKIKTPVAVCGVRGTIMYLEVSPGAVTAFFEGGAGYMQDLISGLEQTVEAGYNSYADQNGISTNTTPTTDQQRLDWGSGWDPGSGVEGYSSPEGSVGVYLSQGGTGGLVLTGRTTGGTPPTTGGTVPFVEVPFDQTTGGGTPPPPPVVIIPDSSGIVYGDITSWGDYEGGMIDGQLSVIGPFWGDNTTGEMLLIVSYNALDNTHTTLDGGAFYGWTLGLWYEGVMEGSIVALFMAPTSIEGVYNVGYLLGTVDGEYFPGISLWMAKGTLTPYIMGEISDVDPADFISDYYDEGEGLVQESDGIYGGLSGSFVGGGTISGSSFGYAYSIDIDGDALPWEIFNFRLENDDFDNIYEDPTSQWTGVMGGGDYCDDEAYWLVRIMDGTWDAGLITAIVHGYYLTDENLGRVNGNLYGIYDDGTWVGGVIGVNEIEPLTYSGMWGEEETSLYWNDGGEGVPVGEEYGLIGSTRSPWNGMSDFIAIGRYNDDGDYLDRSYLWNTEVISYNGPEYENVLGSDYVYTTLDDGAFYGFTIGNWNNGIMDGSMAQIFIDPSGNAGVIIGDLFGYYYPGLNMWMAEGYLMPFIMSCATEFDPADLLDYLYSDDEYRDVFLLYELRDETDPVSIGESEVWFLGVGDGETGTYEDWGIYNLKSGRYNSDIEITQGDEGLYTYGRVWGALLSGEAMFGYSDSSGVMKGKVFGMTDGETWIATSTGMWESYTDGEYYDDTAVYFAYFGGIYCDDGTMLGETVGMFTHDEEFFVDENYMELEVPEYGQYYDPDNTFDVGEIQDVTIDGQSISFEGQNWGIWAMAFDGEYHSGDQVFQSLMVGSSMREGDGGEDESSGYWLTVTVGCQNPNSNILNGIVRGLFIGAHDEATGLGLVNGHMIGSLEYGEGDYPWLEAVSVGEWRDVGMVDLGENTIGNVEDFLNMISVSNFEMVGDGAGIGSFDTDGSMQTDFFSCTGLNFMDEGNWGADWGIWFMDVGGTYEADYVLGPTSLFRLAIGATGIDTENATVMLATMDGYRELDMISGMFKGIWISTMQEDPYHLMAGIITGETTGYIDVDEEGVVTWEAVGAGEWVEVTDLLDPAMLGLDLVDLQDFVSVPITEVCSSIMSGVGSFDGVGSIAATMDISFYAIDAATMQGIWAAIIQGEYSGATGNAWSVDLTGGDITATLNGTLWDDNQWLADVAGTTADGQAFNGQAGGTYEDGNLSGVGAGTWGDEGI